MALTPGTRLGGYEITGSIGAGGMGEVYRAVDTKLGREVAIKTLPRALAQDPDRLARFEREAKLLAALNHAHIGAIYGLDEHEGTRFIAMELIDGQTLEQKLKDGPLPVEDALRIGLQIAEALEAAHEKGVVHRDLKPANIMLTSDGVVKLLDFGLAKAFSGNPNEASPAHSPALSVAMTQQGLILGTAGYMSPEQASGQATDQRADIWGFGVVLYEMLTGLPLFSGESVPHILAAVLQTEPEWNRLPKGVHPRIRQLLERCLKKKVRNRYHSIADARIDIEDALSDPAGVTVPAEGPVGTATHRPLRIGAAAVALTAILAGIVAWIFWPSPGPRPINRFVYSIPEEPPLRAVGARVFALSPDGRQFLYNTAQGLYLRRMGELEARVIPGTEAELVEPFFSPDGRSVGFRRLNGIFVATDGRAPVVISDRIGGGRPLGASWSGDTIFFSKPDGIYRIRATGGTDELIVPAQNGEFLYGPTLLPDGDSLLFSVAPGGNWDAAEIVAQSLTTGERKTLIRGGSDARYVPTGHLVYAFRDGLLGVAFDWQTLTVSGDAVPLVQGVMRSGQNPAANYGIGADGTLAYVSGMAQQGTTVVWMDRTGHEEPIDVPGRDYRYVQLSPNGMRLVLDVRDPESSLWIWDFANETLQPLNLDAGSNGSPLWTPDSQRVLFSRVLDGTEEIYWQAAGGTGTPEALTTGSPRGVNASDVTPMGDGIALLYSQIGSPRDIFLAEIGKPGAEPTPLIATAADELGATVSPDGHWLAYQSGESGRQEILVRPFPVVGDGRWQVSRDGGARPHWSADGHELFYTVWQRPESVALKAAAIQTEPQFQVTATETLFEGPFVELDENRQTYDVARDGRFVMLKRVGIGAGPAPKIIIVQNWFEELKRLVPTK
jgi:eukaryotic-like serine/threonine-protein kinase